MDILTKIVKDKRIEVDLRKELIPIKQLEASVLFNRKTHSLAHQLQQSNSGIIAEHKRRSPSKSVINNSLNVQDVASGYENAGVCGMSVLTDGKYFGGSLDDLLTARASCNLPLLRKEFIIDQYQLLEAKAYGADVCLLIAACLTRKEIEQLSKFAKSLLLDVLLEVHNEEELEIALRTENPLIGINNRDLHSFDTSLDTTLRLLDKIDGERLVVTESGIHTRDDVEKMRSNGVNAFLVGEAFMKVEEPGEELKSLFF